MNTPVGGPDAKAGKESMYSSPTMQILTTGPETRFPMPNVGTSSESTSIGMDTGEELMALEREDIIKDLAILLGSINQVNMEPNGLSFVSNPLSDAVTSITCTNTLRSAPRSDK